MNHKVLFLYFVLTILYPVSSLFSQVPAYVPADSLKAWYPFDGNANDASGNNMHGTVLGTTTAFVTGMFSQAVQFNNVNHTSWFDVNDYVSLPNFTLNDFTVSMWLNYHSNAGWLNHSCCVFSIGDQEQNCTGGFGMYFENDGSARSIMIPVTGTSTDAWFDTIQVDTWYNITEVVRDTSILIFVNGNHVWTQSIPDNHSFNNLPAMVCRHKWYCSNTSATRYNGMVDNLGIWNRPLTPCEVK